jgi:hypothetical protein
MNTEKPNLEQKESAPGPRNLLTNLEETVRAIAEVEGPSWVHMQESGEQNVDAALEAIRYRMSVGPAEYDDPNPIAYTIYGSGGMNRWYVFLDGTVKFSRSHAQSEEHIARAEGFGFEIR